MVVEPNVKNHKDLQLTEYRDAVKQADIIVFLVAHKEFRLMKINEGKLVIDICGVTSSFK
jgi:UDP-N-acetyl-D-mannosaminuronic acid dehydrogenase